MPEVIEMLLSAGSENDLDVDTVLHTVSDIEEGVVYGIEEGDAS